MNDQIPPTFYDTVPDLQINMNELQDFVNKRYLYLREIETQFMRDPNCFQKNTTALDLIDQEFNIKDQEKLKRDIASHFGLALAYCKYDSEKSWFCLQESRLFQYRVVKKGYDLKLTLEKLGLPLKVFNPSNTTSKEFYNQIVFNQTKNKNIKGTINKGFEDNQILYVPFEHALSLVPTHNYFIYKGDIYLPKSDLTSLLQTVFYERIMKIQQKIFNHYDDILTDNRIKIIVNQFEKRREAEAFQKANDRDELTEDNKLKNIRDVDYYYNRTFPLCMFLIQKHINEYSHLMHFGRLQYTLFLKGAGMPLDEALNFFKKKYERKTPGDKFEKQYAYNIRHSYGMEGKRQDYAPYSCRKIQSLNPPTGNECHGCPFKTYSEEKLKQIILLQGFKEVDVAKIMEKMRNKEYSVACMRYFDGKFPGAEMDKVGIHPNHYFKSAMNALKGKKTKIAYEKSPNAKSPNTRSPIARSPIARSPISRSPIARSPIQETKK